MDLLLLSCYVPSLRRTLASEGSQEDSRFYHTWGLVYGLWFLALPITAVLARAVLAPYAWFVVSMCVKKGTAIAVYASLVVGLWPGNPACTHFKTSGTVIGRSNVRAKKLPHALPLHSECSGAKSARYGAASQQLPGLLFNGKWQFQDPASRQKATLGMSP